MKVKASHFTKGFSELIMALRKDGAVIETIKHGLPSARTVESIYYWDGGMSSQGYIIEAYGLKEGVITKAPVMEWQYDSACMREDTVEGQEPMTIASWAKDHGIKHIMTLTEEWDQNGHSAEWYWKELQW